MINILLLGSGGREHAFAWKITQSPVCQQLFVAPGNAGTQTCATNINLDISDFKAIKDFVLNNDIGLLIVGPEKPLVDGIVDFLQADPLLEQLIIIGPSALGATLEGSKAFAKEFMQRHHIPTAAYREFTPETLAEGLQYIAQQQPPIVIKADGLAAGKGVIISTDIPEAQKEFEVMLGGKFGEASQKVVIEDFLSGLEFSVFALTDGKDYVLLPTAKDYKRIGEGDTGLNTGGMGAVSPVSFVDEKLMQKVIDRIVEPTIKGLHAEKISYKGFVFFGLIEVNGDPFVIEYNCRMGDPETEVVLPRLKTDLVDLFVALHQGKLKETKVEFEEKAATTIMLVSGGYPEAYQKGKEISGVEGVQDSIIFHAGTKNNEEKIVTNGGRVIAITSMADKFQDALAISLKNAEQISFEGKYFRRDIGFDL